jgi:glyoxylate reductase
VRVFVGQRLPEPSTRELLPGVEVHFGSGGLPDGEIEQFLREAEAFIPTARESVSAAVLARAPRLGIVASCSVGVDHIDLAACRARCIVVTNTPGVLTDATADLTWALILAVARRLHEGEALLRSGRWDGWKPDELLGISLAGKTLGLFGSGRIGQAVARRGEAFGMKIFAVTSRDGPERFEELLASADVLSIHAPLNPKTRGRFGAAEFRRMKKGAILINTARGPLVDEKALVAALEAGRLRGAGLDVYEREPAVEAGLLSRSDVVLLPHLGSATEETRLAMARMACEEVVRFFRGEPPLHPVA